MANSDVTIRRISRKIGYRIGGWFAWLINYSNKYCRQGFDGLLQWHY